MDEKKIPQKIQNESGEIIVVNKGSTLELAEPGRRGPKIK
jgi:hypothetical protein